MPMIPPDTTTAAVEAMVGKLRGLRTVGLSEYILMLTPQERAIVDGAADLLSALVRERDELQEAVRPLIDEAENLLDSLRPQIHPAFEDPVHGDEVRRLGERIGFGALMSSASASWHQAAIDGGVPGSEFVSGPCFGVLVHDYAAVQKALAAIRSLLPQSGGENGSV